MKKVVYSALLLSVAGATFGNVYITEWMYNSIATDGAEFVEITNTGLSSVDLSGWSFDDNSQTPGSFSLSSIGTLAAGESALIVEGPEATFRAAWNLSASVKIAAPNTHNLARNDEINIYDASNALVDRLTYGDQSFPGSIRTQGISGNADLADLGTNNPLGWCFSVLGDQYGSYHSAYVGSANQDLGNPGFYPSAPVPEPATLAALGIGVAALIRRKSGK